MTTPQQLQQWREEADKTWGTTATKYCTDYQFYIQGYVRAKQETADAVAKARKQALEALYTSPQPLQPITADDVTDEMLDELNANTQPASTRAEILAAVNTVIKHKGEAK